MSELKTNFKSASGLYDFKDDSLNGFIGTRDLGVTIPQFAQIFYFAATALTPFVGAPLNTISFGSITKSLAIPVIDPVAYMVANILGTFVAGVPVFGVNLLITPIKNNTTATSVVIGIGGAVNPAITAGKIEFVIWYQEMPF